MDLETVLERAPACSAPRFEKRRGGDDRSDGGPSALNAIKLLAGVEPLLEAPEAQDLLSSWSLDQGSPDTGQ